MYLVQDYMKKYGYIKDGEMDEMMAEDEEKAMKMVMMRFQHSAGLEMTGEQDEETMNLMKMKRCGNFDDETGMYMMPMDNLETMSRKKRFSVRGKNLEFSCFLQRILTSYILTILKKPLLYA